MKDDGEVERIIRYFKGTDEVSALYIFGSLGKGKTTGESDIDIIILFNLIQSILLT
jgi:predicted nucleotidyltransferase